MKYLTLVIPAAISLALYLFIYRPALVSDSTMSQVRYIEMLHVHILVWWSAFLYLVFCLIYSFSKTSETKVFLSSGLGITLASMVLGFWSGFVFAKQTWGVYFAWDVRFSMAVMNLMIVLCLFFFSFLADKEKFFQVGVRWGLTLALGLLIGSHLAGYFLPTQHLNSALMNIIGQ